MKNSNKIIKGIFHKVYKKLFSFFLFPLIGFFALVWILIRVIPKPSRIKYPCMKTSLPLASGFIVYLAALATSGLSFLKAKKMFNKSCYVSCGIFVIIGLVCTFIMSHSLHQPIKAEFATTYHTPNNPIGDPKGIFPGRVVWVHNPDATNENCQPDKIGHGWFLNENNNQEVIDRMLSEGLKAVTGESSEEAAWNQLFCYHNNIRNKGAVGYQDGEKIFIKINATSTWYSNFNPNDLSIVQNSYYGISETSPHLVLSVLRQLVNTVGVAQENIYVGDPMRHIYKHCYQLWHSEFPLIHYLDHDGYADREKVEVSDEAIVYYSDRGAVLRTGTWDDASVGDPVYKDSLYTIFEKAEYLLNIPVLKGHMRAGITMFAKNHFGSHSRSKAQHLHGGLVKPATDNPIRGDYGIYRVQVDLMGHELLGGKTLIYIMDALWPSDYEINKPDKWMMHPFNNDWMSSLFLSFDPVAIESVGFDFLRSEYTTQRGLATYPQMDGVDDYLHQAASTTNWPSGIEYDPENDGTVISSLGVHEHWNNPIDKQYTKNLDTGNGIELFKIDTQSLSVTPYCFTANFNNDHIELEWITECEVNNLGFIIKRNLIQKHFQKTIASYRTHPELKSQGNSSHQTKYKFSDFEVISEQCYCYNLYSVDLYGYQYKEGEVTINTKKIDKSPKIIAISTFPNPFNANITIHFTLPEKTKISLSIVNLMGQTVKKLLVQKYYQPGEYSVCWNGYNDYGYNTASGIYNILIKTNNNIFFKKIVLLQ